MITLFMALCAACLCLSADSAHIAIAATIGGALILVGAACDLARIYWWKI